MVLILLTQFASAYTLSGYAWPPERLPIEVHWTGQVEGLSHEELQHAVDGAAAAWTAAAPCTFSVVAVEDADAQDWFAAGGVAVLFGDPNDTLPDGVLSEQMLGAGSGAPVVSNNQTFEAAPPAEIVVNEGPYWISDSAINAGACTDRVSLQGFLTVAFGRVLGLAASCAAGEPCTDPDARDATMYWALETCDTQASTLGTDDIDGLAAIYGATYGLAFRCDPGEDDALSADCRITDPADAVALDGTWTFSEPELGSSVLTGSAASYTYASAGSYDVALCVQDPVCQGLRCATQTFVASQAPAASADTDSAPDSSGDASSTGCGCASRPAPASAAGLLGVAVTLLATAARRRETQRVR